MILASKSHGLGRDPARSENRQGAKFGQRKFCITRGAGVAITVNLYYTGKEGAARAFAEEMESSGTADRIRAEEGNVGYRYFSRSMILRPSCSSIAGATRLHSMPTMLRP